NGPVGGAVSDDANFRSILYMQDWFGHKRAHRFKFSGQPVKVVNVVVRPFAVLGLFVVSAAPRKVSRLRMPGSGQGAVRNSISINIFVARKRSQLLQIFFVQHLASIDWLG